MHAAARGAQQNGRWKSQESVAQSASKLVTTLHRVTQLLIPTKDLNKLMVSLVSACESEVVSGCTHVHTHTHTHTHTHNHHHALKFKCSMYEIALNCHSLHNVNYSRRSCVFSYANILHISYTQALCRKFHFSSVCVCVCDMHIHTTSTLTHAHTQKT